MGEGLSLAVLGTAALAAVKALPKRGKVARVIDTIEAEAAAEGAE